jgi:SAM-dependent methyltransferase
MANSPEFDRYARDYRSLHRDSIRASGEEPDYFAAYKAQHAKTRFGTTTPIDILDFGCGVGGMTRHLAAAFPGSRLTGVDVSSESLTLARQAHSGLAHFAHIEGESLPLENHSADLVLAACVFHHITPEARAGWVRELRRILRPGGHLVVYEHNPRNPLTRKVVNDCPFDADAILLPQAETRALLNDAGFQAVRNDFIVFFPHALAALRPMERWLSRVPFGAQYATWGRA